MIRQLFQIQLTCLLMVVLSVTALAQNPLSKADLIKLSEGGMPPSIIIKQIQTYGIAFKADVDSLLELRKAKVPDEVIEVLIARQNQPTAPSAFLEVGRTLYNRGDYAGVVELAMQRIASDTTDSSARYLLAVASLRLQKRNVAETQLAALQQAQDTVSKTLSEKLEALLKRFDGLAKAKTSLETELRGYNSEAAFQVIDQMQLPDAQKDLLRVYLNAYRGRYELARHQLDKLHATQPDLEKDWVAIRTFIDQSAAEYQQSLARLSWLAQFTWSQSAWMTAEHPCYWIPEGLKNLRENLPEKEFTIGLFPDTAAYDNRVTSDAEALLRYTFESATRLVQVAPLSEAGLMWLFQVALMTRPYPIVEATGDRILAGQGKLIVQMSARDDSYYFVLDKKERRVRVIRAAPLTQWVKGATARRIEPGLLFEVGFDNIASISQPLNFFDSYPSTRLRTPQTSMLKIMPGNYAFTEFPLLPEFSHVYGEKAAREITHHFGEFVVHTIGQPKMVASLISLDVKAKGAWNLTSILLAGAAVANSAAGNAQQSAVLLDQLNQMDKQAQLTNMAQQQQSKAWERLAVDTSFDLPVKILFREFDTVLRELH
ncbi:MAG: hypothetical protein JST84_04190 [Acidobacteria bacterium]|nr:hypothetical protein [Acidobacteriota bacterium]